MNRLKWKSEEILRPHLHYELLGHQQPQLILQMFIKQEKLKKMRCKVSSQKHLTLYPRRRWHLPPVRCNWVTRGVHTQLIPGKTSLLSHTNS